MTAEMVVGRAKMVASFDVDAVHLGVSSEICVLEFVVAEAVGEVHHGAIG